MPQLYRYPLDPTGLSSDNLVANEEHILSNRQVRCIAPTYGGYYTESLIVKDKVTNKTLVRGTDYTCGELFEFPTGRYGKEICGVVVINNASVSVASITYQTLGGDYSYSMDAIVAMIENLNLSDRPVAWGDLIGRPATFDPATHLHDAGDIYGFEYVVHSIERLRSAVLTGDVASHDELYRYVDSWGEDFRDLTTGIQTQLYGHMADSQNPHLVTKEQVGLGQVHDLPLATIPVANAGTSNVHYLTPLTAKSMIDTYAMHALDDHIANKENPHNVTKKQIGLGFVENLPLASKAEAEAGGVNTTYMTPSRVKEAIAVQALEPLNNHRSSTSNPHIVTKTQIGLSSVDNFATASEPEAIEGNATNLFVTPKGVKSSVLAIFNTGTFDTRYIQKGTAVESSIRVVGNQFQAFVGGTWRVVWPPQWQ